jgi:hypothetical protein
MIIMGTFTVIGFISAGHTVIYFGEHLNNHNFYLQKELIYEQIYYLYAYVDVIFYALPAFSR